MRLRPGQRDTLEIPLWRGTAFPATPIEGRMFYRTDLDAVFWYDATRAKWLGELEADGGGYNGAMGGAGYLTRFGGVAFSATIGIYVPYDATVVGLSYSMAAALTGNFEVRRNGSAIASVSHAGAATGADMTLDADFASGGILSLYNTAGAVTNPQLRVWWRRHAT